MIKPPPGESFGKPVIQLQGERLARVKKAADRDHSVSEIAWAEAAIDKALDASEKKSAEKKAK